ncbi:BPL-N domain-containing protein [Desulfohalovibrio reitneri]|uniref:BPL-N domain-containing protein n=1 Tax=Desulfohalovibrio reitneri TaxID=1307759 RepID=UPI0004A6F0BE|nr:BPL-N domain-containing protein [Desulfohalovibrio reitneri]
MSIYVLWDDSHIWGLLLWRALHAWGLEHRLVTAEEVRSGLLVESPPDMLAVPGGNARAKHTALGKGGRTAVRNYVESGGAYLGFCGGAGLGLSDGGLRLCPWCRRPFENRMQHLISGLVRVLPGDPSPLRPDDAPDDLQFPVFWPGRFDPDQAGEVEVLARYGGPGDELWVADIPLDSLPPSVLADWQARYGLSLWPSFLQGQPCLVTGRSGRGRYVLSYAHLETPDHPGANAWLRRLLTQLAGAEPPDAPLPPWPLADLPPAWDDPVLARTRTLLDDLMRLGREHHLLFERTPWLTGWRRGLPGLTLNALSALARQTSAVEPGNDALAFWRERAGDFAERLEPFALGVKTYLLAERLDMTLSHSPDSSPVPGLAEQRRELFGSMQRGGGLACALQNDLESLARLTLDRG